MKLEKLKKPYDLEESEDQEEPELLTKLNFSQQKLDYT
jgi:hypothetical protein